MNKRDAKIEALRLASIVVNELEGSDAVTDNKVRNEINKIAISLAIRADNLSKPIIKTE